MTKSVRPPLAKVLIILDVMLPGLNGYEVCRQLRAAGVEAPVLLLTAKSETEDIVLGFQVGADDYVTKPFRIKEVLARMERMLSRSGHGEPGSLKVGDCKIDLKARTAQRNNEVIPLTPKEFELLLFLNHHRNVSLPRERILSAVWGNRLIVSERSVDRCIKSLRKKIEADPGDPRWIQTVHRIGYRLLSD
jgi:DNA-binding response OmpR family regulator